MPKPKRKPTKSGMRRKFKDDFERIQSMLQTTIPVLEPGHQFIADVQRVMAAISTCDEPERGILALHNVSIAVAELLWERGFQAKISLLAAMGLVDAQTGEALSKVFHDLFHTDEVTQHVAQLIGALLADPAKFSKAPVGSTIQMNGFQAIKLGSVGVGHPMAKAKPKAKGKAAKPKRQDLPPHYRN